MMKTYTPLLLSAALLAASCSTLGSSVSPEERVQLQAIEGAYKECLGGQLRLVIDGSDDVALLARTAMGVCSPKLIEIREWLVAAGKHPAYADGWIKGVEQSVKPEFTAFALQRKAARKAQMPSAAEEKQAPKGG